MAMTIPKLQARAEARRLSTREQPTIGPPDREHPGSAKAPGSAATLPPAGKKSRRTGGSPRLPGPTQPERYTLREIAGTLKVCTKTVRRLITKNSIPVERVGSQIRIRADHLPMFTKKEW